MPRAAIFTLTVIALSAGVIGSIVIFVVMVGTAPADDTDPAVEALNDADRALYDLREQTGETSDAIEQRLTWALGKPPPTLTHQRTLVVLPPLFADASDGIYQWEVGASMAAGRYRFDCGEIGNVSVLERAPHYVVRRKTGNQRRTLRAGDVVTVSWCKVYGPTW